MITRTKKNYGVLHYIYIEKCYIYKQITKHWLQASWICMKVNGVGSSHMPLESVWKYYNFLFFLSVAFLILKSFNENKLGD